MAPTISFITFDDDDGSEIVKEIPAKYEVCPRCGGEGKHVNPSVDEGGITGEEMAELGEDFREAYFGGVFDIQCEECHGERVVLVPDEERANPELLEAYWEQVMDEREFQDMVSWEVRMGC